MITSILSYAGSSLLFVESCVIKPIFIPCHRVVGANGKLVGYGGGLDIKEKLLNLEK